MDIYLDTKDIINIMERSSPCTPTELDHQLRQGNHNLVISCANILELSAPLLEKKSKTDVMSLLNHVERLPVKFVADFMLYEMELREAVTAFMQHREYRQVNPFTDRFDKAFMGDASPTKLYLRLSLAEAVFELWMVNPDVFNIHKKQTRAAQEVFRADRNLSKWPNLQKHFETVINRDLEVAKISFAPAAMRKFSRWIYEDADRCPAIRLQYEVHHRILKNLADIPKSGDMFDFSHVRCIPYVKLLTLDKRIYSYVSQVLKDLSLGSRSWIFSDARDLLKKI